MMNENTRAIIIRDNHQDSYTVYHLDSLEYIQVLHEAHIYLHFRGREKLDAKVLLDDEARRFLKYYSEITQIKGDS